MWVWVWVIQIIPFDKLAHHFVMCELYLTVLSSILPSMLTLSHTQPGGRENIAINVVIFYYTYVPLYSCTVFVGCCPRWLKLMMMNGSQNITKLKTLIYNNYYSCWNVKNSSALMMVRSMYTVRSKWGYRRKICYHYLYRIVWIEKQNKTKVWMSAIKRFDPHKYVVMVPIRFSICFVSIKMYKLQLTNNIPWAVFSESSRYTYIFRSEINP